MSVSDADIAYIYELFAPLGPLTSRKMMGGLTLYCDGQVFAILDRHATPYLKAKGVFAADLAANGAQQFGADDGKTMGYWTLPDAALDDTDIACDWARRALAALG
jgi:DNA transformation protein